MSFNSILWSPLKYRDAAVVAKEAGEKQLERLEWMTLQPKKILDIGCGTGELTAKLSERYPQATVLAVDINQDMIEYASNSSSYCVCLADGKRLPLREQSMDLIVANFFLPWQPDFKTILQEWRRILRPDGLLILTALGPDTFLGWQQQISLEVIPTLIDMHDLGDLLMEAGFSDPLIEMDYYTLIYRDRKKLISELIAAGMITSAESTKLAALNAEADNTWPCTYEVIYAHAFGPALPAGYKANPEGITKIPIAALRRK